MWLLKCVRMPATLALALLGCVPTGQNPQSAFDRGAAALAACIEAKCDRLDLDGSRLHDFTVLNDLPHVTALMVSYSNFDDLADISGMSQLRELHISNTNVADLQGLSAFPKLTLLHASNLTAPVDVTVVSQLTSLQELVIGARSGDDLSHLAGLSRLKTLRIDHGTIVDLSVLLKLQRLEELTIYSDLPQDLSPILGLKNLKTLMLRNDYLTEDFLQAVQARKRGTVVIFEPVIVC